jgi:hypothetical protein
VGFALQSKGMNKRLFMAMFLCFTLIFSLLSAVLVKPVEGKTSRVAVISSLGGDVTVKKGGGSKSYDSYEGMSLNQGDTLFTSSGASVTLNLSNGDSEISLGENSEFNISDLAGSGSGKISKLKMWAGSMWVKVKSLAGSNDQFEVETPTAVMGVRGTQFFVGVDPSSGKSKLAVGAGVVAATVSAPSAGQGGNPSSASGIAPPPPEEDVTEVVVYMTQQLTVDSREESKNLSVNIEPLDIEAIVKQASPNVIQAIVQNKESIDKENAEFIARAKNDLENGKIFTNANSTFVVKSIEELNKVIVNLNNLVGNIAKTAVDTNKVDKATMDKTIEDANKNIKDSNQKLDLNNVKPFDKTAGVDAKAENQRKQEQQKLDAVKQQLQLADKKKQDELKAGLDVVLKALENTRIAIEDANKKAAAEAKAKAENVLLESLNPADKAKFAQDKVKAETPTQQTQPQPQQPQQPPVAPGGHSGSSTVIPNVTISGTEDEDNITVTVNLKDFVELYGAELHLVFNGMQDGFHGVEYDLNSPFKPANDETPTIQAVPNLSVDNHGRVVEGNGISELIYVVTRIGTDAVSINSSGQNLVHLKFSKDINSIHIPDGGIILVDKAGNQIKPTINVLTNPIFNNTAG